jgi:hypothetical protein
MPTAPPETGLGERWREVNLDGPKAATRLLVPLV